MHIEKLKRIKNWVNHKSFPLERLISLSKLGYLIPVNTKKGRGVLIVSNKVSNVNTYFNLKLCNTQRIYKYEFWDSNYYIYDTKITLQRFAAKHQLTYAFEVIND